MSYKEFLLPDETVLSYLRENLQEYHDYILVADYYLDGYDFTNIMCKTFWSDCYDYTSPNCLHGYLSDKELFTEAQRWVIKQIRQFLSSGNKRYCLSLDLILKYQEAVSQYSDKSISIGNKDCCYLLTQDSTDETICNAIRLGQDGHFGIAFLIESFCTLENGDNIPAEKIPILVQKTEKIILGAYDGEGFVLMGKKE